jgi:CheY-like chemotaxis protein
MLALTAKPMKGDREKCLEAGASEALLNAVVHDQSGHNDT